VSKKLDRRGKRKLGTSNNIPGISAELWLRSGLDASNSVIKDFRGVTLSEARDHAQG
jgi:hypothetical protein